MGRSFQGALIAVFISIVLPSCTPLYLPPVPDSPAPTTRLEVSARGQVGSGRPRVIIEPLAVPEPGFLAIQWFSPVNREVASESIWLEPSMTGEPLIIDLPGDVDTSSGRWRALVSFGSTLLRQVSIEVP